MKEAEIISILRLLAESDDIIIEVFKKPKRSLLFPVWDTIADVAPSITDKLLNQQVVYLIAGEHDGTFVELDGHKVVSRTVIPNWEPHMKHSFTSLTLDGHLYKKYRVLRKEQAI